MRRHSVVNIVCVLSVVLDAIERSINNRLVGTIGGRSSCVGRAHPDTGQAGPGAIEKRI